VQVAGLPASGSNPPRSRWLPAPTRPAHIAIPPSPRSFDPHSGVPARGLLSATVTGPELTLADALATALFAAGERGLRSIAAVPAYDAFVLKDDGTVLATPGFGPPFQPGGGLGPAASGHPRAGAQRRRSGRPMRGSSRGRARQAERTRCEAAWGR
jgi:hypothetical protein